MDREPVIPRRFFPFLFDNTENTRADLLHHYAHNGDLLGLGAECAAGRATPDDLPEPVRRSYYSDMPEYPWLMLPTFAPATFKGMELLGAVVGLGAEALACRLADYSIRTEWERLRRRVGKADQDDMPSTLPGGLAYHVTAPEWREINERMASAYVKK